MSGPGGTQVATGARTFQNLAPGTYTVSATNLLTGTAVATPAAATQATTLAAGEAKTVTVTYNTAQAFALRLVDVIAAGGGLSAPIYLGAPAGDARLFVAERAGRIRIVRNGQLLATPFLDITARVRTDGEAGLLSFAFHPQFATNRTVFVHFIDGARNIVVERYTASMGNPDVADPAPGAVITIPHPNQDNHYGGRVAFGPDGMLYLSTGDGGGAGDPGANGQNLNTLLGKLLRLDVASMPYGIPAGNPFAGQANRRPEIWAYGLRNPWRFAFDASAGTLYIGDVGQNRREEINAAPAASAALNYGWPIMEASLCYPADPCNAAGLTLPITEYDRAQGVSVTGGHVYRGSALPELVGRYLYADFQSGWIRSLRWESSVVFERIQWNIPAVAQLASFGEDGTGELYVISLGGRVARIAR